MPFEEHISSLGYRDHIDLFLNTTDVRNDLTDGEHANQHRQ